MSYMNLDALKTAAMVRDPFQFFVAPGFLSPEAAPEIYADFPAIDRGGSFPVSELDYGPAFARLLDEVQGKPFWSAMSEKFGIDLFQHPQMITVRGRCQKKDGRIHPDTESKIITCLIYLNRPGWNSPDGRLRMLRSDDNLEDYIAEVSPEWGTLLTFRRADNSYHGHTVYEGERRSIQINWVTSQEVVDKELARHRMSARLKKLVPFS
ncbi:MAG: 2OG-Fe(II) oxygenase [Nitrospirota bacterium]|nr:2OG-Fe(II) oxygenase [Nitrospirota bacterium]